VKTYRIGIIGFGVVGQGIGRLLHEKRALLAQKYGFDPQVIAISDPVKGQVYNPEGIDLGKALEAAREGIRLEETRIGEPGWDSLRVITESEAEIILEITPTNLETGQPGLDHIRAALQAGKHVATTNKGPIALAYQELKALAEEMGVQLRFEGTVLSGTPAINLATKDLAGSEVRAIRGIVNGTTNYILTQMEQGMSYEAALKDAQAKGYAEAKPDADVEGWDALAKIVILANVVMDAGLRVEDGEREGITGITPERIEEARHEGKRWKLIAQALREGNRVVASVKPKKVESQDPLYTISGVLNALVFETDTLGTIFVSGPGAGSVEAGYALLTDMLDIHRTLTAGDS